MLATLCTSLVLHEDFCENGFVSGMWRHLMATNSNIPSFLPQLDPPRTPPTRDSLHPELAGLQYKPLPLPPAMFDGQCDRARQPYIE